MQHLAASNTPLKQAFQPGDRRPTLKPPSSGWLLSIEPQGLFDRPLLTITSKPGLPGIDAHISPRGDLLAWVHSKIGGRVVTKPITATELAQLLGWQVPQHLRGAL